MLAIVWQSAHDTFEAPSFLLHSTFPFQYREHSGIDAVIILDCPRFRAHEFIVRSFFGGWNFVYLRRARLLDTVLKEAKQPKRASRKCSSPALIRPRCSPDAV